MQQTPYYKFPYLTPSDFICEMPKISQAQAERYEEALKDAKVPPGNPDVNDILLRLRKLETPQVQVLTSPRAQIVGGGEIRGLGVFRHDPALSSTSDLAEPDKPDHIRIMTSGWYDIHLASFSTAAPGYLGIGIDGPGLGLAGIEAANRGVAWGAHVTVPAVYLSQGTLLRLRAVIEFTRPVDSFFRLRYLGEKS